MKIKLSLETNTDGYNLEYDYETQTANLLGFLIAELEEDDDYFVIAIDGRCFVSKSVVEILWFLQSYLKQVEELITTHDKSDDFDSLKMEVMIEAGLPIEMAFSISQEITALAFSLESE
jgi:hypothetical protein